MPEPTKPEEHKETSGTESKNVEQRSSAPSEVIIETESEIIELPDSSLLFAEMTSAAALPVIEREADDDETDDDVSAEEKPEATSKPATVVETTKEPEPKPAMKEETKEKTREADTSASSGTDEGTPDYDMMTIMGANKVYIMFVAGLVIGAFITYLFV